MLKAMLLLAIMQTGQFTTTTRVINQDQGSWQVNYRLKNEGDDLTLRPADLIIKSTGWVSNSRSPSREVAGPHVTPKLSEWEINGSTSNSGNAEIIKSPEEIFRCTEKASVKIWVGDQPFKQGDIEPLNPVIVKSCETLCLQIRMDHNHALFGDYDPLLGTRKVTIQLGKQTIKDEWFIDHEQYVAMSTDTLLTWGEVPEEHRDKRQFVSQPDSLLLNASVPGDQYFRFPEIKVRYSNRMKLTFWYMIAPGTEGEFKARVAQYRESPNAWKVLSEGGSEHTLKVVGKWTKFEKIIKTETETTTMALDFRIANAEFGEVWIDDVTLEPMDAANKGP
jgi:hypothetical protein